jgi:hypothetical protein
LDDSDLDLDDSELMDSSEEAADSKVEYEWPKFKLPKNSKILSKNGITKAI